MKAIVAIYLFMFFFISLALNTGCKKEPTAPIISTTSVSSITDTAIISGGNISSDGGNAVFARGICWDTQSNPTTSKFRTDDGSGIGTFISIIKRFNPNTTYHVRAYATNSVGTAYGEDLVFTTNKIAPKLTTLVISLITSKTASSGGTITDEGGDAILQRGVCWNTAGSPTIADNKSIDGNGNGSFVSQITGLEGYKTYYVRAYATNGVATGYGNQVKFITESDEIVIDYDDNVYNTVKIGKQLWMAENLRTAHYNNGNPIPNVSSNDPSTATLKTGAYNWYNDNVSYKNPYGALYNWYAVTDSRNLCPAGWHVPTSTDWNNLFTFLGGNDVAGGKMKEEGTDHWVKTNIADNSSGFNALPAGSGGHSGHGTPLIWYDGMGTSSVFGSSSRDNLGAPYIIWLDGSTKVTPSNAWENMTHSIRCIKD